MRLMIYLTISIWCVSLIDALGLEPRDSHFYLKTNQLENKLRAVNNEDFSKLFSDSYVDLVDIPNNKDNGYLNFFKALKYGFIPAEFTSFQDSNGMLIISELIYKNIKEDDVHRYMDLIIRKISQYFSCMFYSHCISFEEITSWVEGIKTVKQNSDYFQQNIISSSISNQLEKILNSINTISIEDAFCVMLSPLFRPVPLVNSFQPYLPLISNRLEYNIFKCFSNTDYYLLSENLPKGVMNSVDGTHGIAFQANKPSLYNMINHKRSMNLEFPNSFLFPSRFYPKFDRDSILIFETSNYSVNTGVSIYQGRDNKNLKIKNILEDLEFIEKNLYAICSPYLGAFTNGQSNKFTVLINPLCVRDNKDINSIEERSPNDNFYSLTLPFIYRAITHQFNIFPLDYFNSDIIDIAKYNGGIDNNFRSLKLYEKEIKYALLSLSYDLPISYIIQKYLESPQSARIALYDLIAHLRQLNNLV